MFLKASVGSGSARVRVEVFGSGSSPGIAMPVRFGSRFKKKEPVRVRVQKLVPVQDSKSFT